ncbi:S24 family peptidase [Candidatus Electronema sp. JM]|uniref:S24 family peptidase n=1 Tax=Candidatus Electronema sp. JM TaxID=3401571 RepID=UPI003AA983E1
MTSAGNSMEATIYNGETAMIDTGRTSAHEGGVFVIRMDNNVMIKRVSLRLGDKIKNIR